jgi:pyruvate dehydrogenase E1 component beta subunit
MEGILSIGSRLLRGLLGDLPLWYSEYVYALEADNIIDRYKVTKGLLDRFGEKRVIDSPITESGFCGLTVGAALAGLHPVVRTTDKISLLIQTLTPSYSANS